MFEIPPPEVLEVAIPSISSSITCMIFAPSGYHDPPDGPDTIRTNVSALALVATSTAADAANIVYNFFMKLPPYL
jgi:hypothetical protein